MLAQSDGPAWLALLVAGAALAWQVLSHFLGKAERQRKDDEMRALRQAQAEALARIAETTSSSTLERDHAEGAQLSAAIVATSRGNRRLVVRNLGPGGAQLRQVDFINEPRLRLHRTGLEGENTAIDLLPTEEHSMTLLGRAEEWPINVVIGWLDSRGHQERVQQVTPKG